MTTAQSLYSSHLFVAGIILVVLGLGNYLAADSKVDHYQEVMAEVAPQVGAAPAFLPREELRSFPSEARERWEIARAKLDFYHVVLDGGRLMAGVGIACTALALLRLRRQRVRMAQG
jgi:hypothetical protein